MRITNTEINIKKIYKGVFLNSLAMIEYDGIVVSIQIVDNLTQ